MRLKKAVRWKQRSPAATRRISETLGADLRGAWPRPLLRPTSRPEDAERSPIGRYERTVVSLFDRHSAALRPSLQIIAHGLTAAWHAPLYSFLLSHLNLSIIIAT